jgi:hypothetical protein
MAQLDVYPNPNPTSRARVPYLVALSSDLLGAFDATVVAPLRPKADREVIPVLRLNPTVRVGAREYFLRPQETGGNRHTPAEKARRQPFPPTRRDPRRTRFSFHWILNTWPNT